MSREPIESGRYWDSTHFVCECCLTKDVRKLEADYAELEEKLKTCKGVIEKSWCILNGVLNRSEADTLNYEQCTLMCNYIEEALKTITGDNDARI